MCKRDSFAVLLCVCVCVGGGGWVMYMCLWIGACVIKGYTWVLMYLCVCLGGGGRVWVGMCVVYTWLLMCLCVFAGGGGVGLYIRVIRCTL